ncbi:MAG: hypothetical protein LBV71_19130 [Prevotella sp.]|jgi:hypothetical protein|nr:hypothetical protein [Prevotella sp.]
MEEIDILTRFPNREMTAREYLMFSKNILLQLKSFSSDFNALYAWGSETNMGRYLKDDLSDFESVVFNQLKDDNIAYSNPDKSNKKFTLDSKCFIGYNNSYSTNDNYKQSQITVTIGAGKENPSNDDVGILNFEFSEILQSKLNLPNLIQLLEFSINLVNPYYGTISSFEFGKKTNKKKDNIEIGWITYIFNKEVFKLLPKNVGKKILSNGGVIFWLSEERPLSTNERAVQKAIEIRNILAEHEFLNNGFE